MFFKCLEMHVDDSLGFSYHNATKVLDLDFNDKVMNE